jgi:hypothetical protein
MHTNTPQAVVCILLWNIAHSIQFPFIGQIYMLVFHMFVLQVIP